MARQNDGYTNITRSFTIAGALWALFATSVGFVNQLQLFLQIPESDTYFGYGMLRPIYTTSLIFGMGLSFFMAAALHMLPVGDSADASGAPLASDASGAPLASDASGEPLAGRRRAARIAFVLLQSATLSGIAAIFLDANKGREYGEMPFLSDLMLEASLLIFVGIIVVTLADERRKQDPHRTTASAGGNQESADKHRKHDLHRTIASGAAGAGGLVIYLLGNMSVPVSLLRSVVVWSGLEDAAVQEYYRAGVLGYLVIMPLLAVLQHYVPRCLGRRLYSERLFEYQALGMIVAVPLAGGAGLVYTPAPPEIQTIGIVAVLAMTVAIVAGYLNVRYTFAAAAGVGAGASTNAGANVVPDADARAVGGYFRAGAMFLLIAAVMRALATPRAMQQHLGYTWWNALDISVDVQTYGLLILFGAALYIVSRLGGRPVLMLSRVHLALGILGCALMFASNLAGGIAGAFNLRSITPEGVPAVHEWTDVIFGPALGSAPGARDPELKYLFGFRGLYFVGFAALLLGSAVGSLNVLLAFARSRMPASLPATAEQLAHERQEQAQLQQAQEQTQQALQQAQERPAQQHEQQQSRTVAAALMSRPVALVGATAVLAIFGFYIQTALFFGEKPAAAGTHFAPPDPLVLMGQEIYIKSGCQYCHTQNVRPLAHDVARFVKANKFGHFPLPDSREYAFASPFPRGSARIGQDLGRLAGKYDSSWLVALLSSSRDDTLKSSFHKFSYMFFPSERLTERDALFLSWKIRAMMNAGAPFSDNYQRGVFASVVGKTRGDALAEYLLSLGNRQMDYSGRYYKR